MSRDDGPLVAGAGFDDFFRVEYPKLLALGRALAPSAAQDLAQEALIRACREWEAVVGYDIPGAWLRRVMLNLIADHHRSSKRRERMIYRLSTATQQEDRHGEIGVDHECWFDVVRSLPRRQAEVVALHYIDQLPIADVATVLRVSSGTVKSSLARARRKLERSIDTTNGSLRNEVER